MGTTFTFAGELFEMAVDAAWVFVALPADAADEILDLVPPRRGFGSVKVEARIGSTEWSTSIFPSKEVRSYVLPVKRSVREAEKVDTGDSVRVAIEIILD